MRLHIRAVCRSQRRDMSLAALWPLSRLESIESGPAPDFNHTALLKEFGRPLVGLEIADRLPPLRFHDLRHMAGTVMHEAGVPLKRAQEILGHALERTTLAIFTFDR